MKLDHSASALVIVGGWNTHIINPNWIRRYLFDGKKEKLKVDFLAELPYSFNPQFAAQRISSKEIKIQLQGTIPSPFLQASIESEYCVDLSSIWDNVR